MSSPTPDTFRTAGEFINRWRRPLLLTHAKPDGDALGALTAMRAFLQTCGAAAIALLFDEIPHRYQLFEKYDSMPRWGTDIFAKDLSAIDGIIILDTGTYNQLEPIAKWLRASDLPKLVIDHHVTQDELDDHHVIDSSAAATCLLLHEWANAMQWPVDQRTSEALFVGIAMDTGWFVHSNTDDRALTTAAELVRQGVAPHELHQQLFQRESEARIRLMGAALDSLQLFADGRAAIMILSDEAFEITRATPADTEDIVNEPLRIESVVTSVLLVQSDANLVRASFRSKPPIVGAPDVPDVDVAALAQTFGGGGHVRAAGARIKGTLPEVEQQVIERLASACSL